MAEWLTKSPDDVEEYINGDLTRRGEIFDGHIVYYNYYVYDLNFKQATFERLEYHTEYRRIPTSWYIELEYERVSNFMNTYNFSIRLKRVDPHNNRVRASVNVMFYDEEFELVLDPMAAIRERMIPDDELKDTLENILPIMLSRVRTIEISVIIQHCHGGPDGAFQHMVCAPKDDKEKKNGHLSKL